MLCPDRRAERFRSADGKPLSSYQSYDLAAEGVGYSTSGGFIDDITDQIDEYAEKIKSGEIEVPSTVK